MVKERLTIEVHLSHTCNLSCESCSHYSDFHFPGALSVETAEGWYRSWSPRVDPDRFTLLGGEPTLNRDLVPHVRLARRYRPRAQIRIVSNGFFLHRHPELPAAMAEVGNVRLQLTRHFDRGEYLDRYREAQAPAQRWQAEHGIDLVMKDSFSSWTQRYQHKLASPLPFDDGDPRASWKICPCRYCKQLHDGRLWKCPSLAYLPMLGKKVPLADAWDPYTEYQALRPDCSEEDLRVFWPWRTKSTAGCARPLSVPWPSSGTPSVRAK